VVYKSGKFKDMLSGSRKPEDVTPEEQKMVQGLIDEVYGKFKTVVAEGRTAANEANASDGRKLVENWANFADGRVFSGREAYELGFVDELGGFDTAVERAIDLSGEIDANVVEYRQIIELADLFRLFGKGEPATVKVDLGVNTPNLKPGWLYFLYTEYIN
jgi:protease-4